VVLVDFFSAPWRAWVRVGSEAGNWRKGMACGGLDVKRAWQVPESGGWATCQIRVKSKDSHSVRQYKTCIVRA
jgi:hypothetical protein